MSHRTQGWLDLVVFLAVLGTDMTLVLRGVQPESLAAIAIAVSGLYAAWRGNAGPLQPPSSPSAEDDTPDGKKAREG